MSDLSTVQLIGIGLIFIWSGFVRSGLGFGGAVLSLPFILLIDNRPIVYLPIIAVHLLIFSSITVLQNHLRHRGSALNSSSKGINWNYIWRSLPFILPTKMVGVIGVITLPAQLLSNIIFGIIFVYSLSYIFNRPFKSTNPILDKLFLMMGGYISGTSLIGAPLIMAVYLSHVAKEQLRDTLFVLWFILVCIKMVAFVLAGVDLQLIQHLWLLPLAAIGHFVGLRVHDYLLHAESKVFYRVLGVVLLIISIISLTKDYWMP